MIMPLVGSGVRCDDNAAHGAHMDLADMSMADMPGMPMPINGENGSTDTHQDCSLPWSSGLCQSMASCAPSAMTVEQATLVAHVIGAHDEPILKAQWLRSVIRAPEPPPPRA